MGQPVAAHKRKAALQLAERTPLLHWPLGFAQVFARGGFTVVLGNPPWDRLKLQEEEYFAARAPAVAQARNKAERGRAINDLATHAPGTPERRVYDDFVAAKQRAEAGSLFCHGPRYPLTGIGDVNTYALFAETALQVLHPQGRAGLVLPSGIATDDLTKEFFQAIVDRNRLARLLGFDNARRVFPAVHPDTPFCLLTLGTPDGAIRFAHYILSMNQLADPRRNFTLSADDIARLNPNTRTCPVFRSQQDAEITKSLYQRVPVLRRAGDNGNFWRLKLNRIFDMGKPGDQRLAELARDELDRAVPMYEAKYFAAYDHRLATFAGDDDRQVTDQEKADPSFSISAREVMSRTDVEARLTRNGSARQWLVAFRDITNATNERTAIAAVLPRLATNYTVRLAISQLGPGLNAVLVAGINSLVFDFVARQKLGGTHLSDYITEQLPIPSPDTFAPTTLLAVVPRVLELTYSAHDLQPFYADVVAENPAWDPRTGADRGQPWRWNPERRALLRAELDAIYARLYGLTRDELRYILDPADVMGADYPSETFRVLKDKEMRQFGEYRTRRLVLEAWDRQGQADAV